jgi:hypothetical protein
MSTIMDLPIGNVHTSPAIEYVCQDPVFGQAPEPGSWFYFGTVPATCQPYGPHTIDSYPSQGYKNSLDQDGVFCPSYIQGFEAASVDNGLGIDIPMDRSLLIADSHHDVLYSLKKTVHETGAFLRYPSSHNILQVADTSLSEYPAWL